MTYDEFVALVQAMRDKQVEYFRTRSSDALNESKRLEARVDRQILAHQSKQGKLFE